MAQRSPVAVLRTALFLVLGAALLVAVWVQRSTIADAVTELRALPAGVVAVLVALGVLERVSRADIVRRLLGTVSFTRALTIHDVGTAVSKGIPFGGPVATALRWSIARDAGVPTVRFTSMLVAYGVATTFVTWLLPLAVLVAELFGRPATAIDLVLIAVSVTVIAASGLFWAVVLRSERVADWTSRRLRWLWGVVGRRVPAAHRHDPAGAVLALRGSLRAVARRPVDMLVRTALAQACGAVVLLVALRGLGVGVELGVLELARIYFVVTLLSSFVPVPGGVGVVEAGLASSLTAAGVAAPTALAGVIVYRLLTYVAPIVLGAVLYAVWRSGWRLGATAPASGDAEHLGVLEHAADR